MAHPSEAYTFILDADAQGFSTLRAIPRAVGRLIKNSRWTALLRPGNVTPIYAVEQIENSVKSWPAWHSGPWIIAGRMDAPKTPISYDGPFIEDCSGTGYDQQITQLLGDFDWAFFSYFTTYQSHFYTFLTRLPELRFRLLSAAAPQGALLESYHGRPPLLRMLKNATFYDYGAEGRLAYELALKRGEDIPFILCQIELDNPDLYHRWDHETGSGEDFIWFEEPLGKLEQVDEFCVSGYDEQRALYKLLRALDRDAYLALWAMTSYDYRIAEATLSADCNIRQLKELITSHNYFDISSQADEVGSWAYGQIYGGGADEHHAIFHGRDATLTQQIWELSGESSISRF